MPAYLAPAAALVIAAALVGYLSVRMRVVSIVGFLFAGILIGPAQLGLVASTETVSAAADIGVILLLFTIGIEFSLERLARVWRWIVLGGGAQVALTIAMTMGLVLLVGGDWRGGLFTGFVVALSSTAIVLTILAEKGQTNSVRGRLALSVLIMQDLAVVAMVVVLPLLAADAEGGAGALFTALSTAIAVVAAVLIVARRFMPKVLDRVAALCSPEVFLLTVVAICLGTAFLTALAGVSVSLGAFLAGLVVSESRQSTQALSEVLPLKIIFSAIFFVSVGMLLDLNFLLDNLLLVLALAVTVLVVKLTATTLALLPTRVGWRQAAAAGLLLGQIGEFSFVLLSVGEEAGLEAAALGEDGFQAVVATTVLLMVLTPVLAILGDRLLRGQQEPEVEPSDDETVMAEGEWHDHVVLLGWGQDSIALARDLRARGIPVIITTLNPGGAVAAERAGIPVLTGDSLRGSVLEMVGVSSARMIVVAEDDQEHAASIATVVRGLTTAPVVVRAEGVPNLAGFAEAGVSHVVDVQAASRRRLVEAVRDRLHVPRPDVPVPGRGTRTWVDTTRLSHVPVPLDSGCTHADQSQPILPDAEGCAECLREGRGWIHLRLCLQCGNVGCCDSSPGRHSRQHLEETGHPLMASLEGDEAWAYCFVDDITFDYQPRP